MGTGAAQGGARKYLRALRAFSLPLSVLPPVAATAAVAPPRSWDWAALVATVLTAGAMHLTGNRRLRRLLPAGDRER